MNSMSDRPQKRQLTHRQLKILRRKRRQEKRRAVALLLCAVMICAAVTAAAVMLPPREDETISIASILAANATAEPTPAPTPAPSPTAIVVPAAAVVVTNAQKTPEPTDGATVEPTIAPTIEPTIEPTAEPTPEPTAEPTATPVPVLRSVHFRVTGDIMATETQLEYAKKAGEDGGYNFDPQFELIADSLQAADFTVGNLETTIGKYRDKDYSGYPNFNSPETLLETLRDSGYDMFTLANNHMLDRWFDGMKTTVGNVEAYGFEHVGAYRTQEERSSAKIVEIGGVKFGFLAYTTTANGREESSSENAKLFGVPFLGKADIEGDVARLRSAGAEVVIAFPHWGTEYSTSPDSTQKRYAEKMAAAGVDIILGSHPHVLQPMGFVESEGREVFVAFSLGNFISSQRHSGYTDTGMILDFTVSEQPDGSFKVENIGYVPTYCWKHGKTLQVVPAAKYVENRPNAMDSDTYKRMKKCLNNTVKMMGDKFTLLEE